MLFAIVACGIKSSPLTMPTLIGEADACYECSAYFVK